MKDEATDGRQEGATADLLTEVILWLRSSPRVRWGSYEYVVTGWKGGFLFYLSRPSKHEPAVADIRDCKLVRGGE